MTSLWLSPSLSSLLLVVDTGHCGIGAVLNGSLQSRSKGGEESFPTCIVAFDLVTDDSKINRLTISWWLLQMLSASMGVLHSFVCGQLYCMGYWLRRMCWT